MQMSIYSIYIFTYLLIWLKHAGNFVIELIYMASLK